MRIVGKLAGTIVSLPTCAMMSQFVEMECETKEEHFFRDVVDDDGN